MVPELGDSIDKFISLSERTNNSLRKNGIFCFKDFMLYMDDIRLLKNLNGIGDKAIRELDEIFTKYDGYYKYSLRKVYEKIGIKKEVLGGSSLLKINDVEYSPYFKIYDNEYYLYCPAFIAFTEIRYKKVLIKNKWSFFDLLKEYKNVGIYYGVGNQLKDKITEICKKIFYFYGIKNLEGISFKKENKLDFLLIFNYFFKSQSSLDKTIILSRLGWFLGNVSENVNEQTLQEIGDDANLSRERIRQLESQNVEMYLWYINYLSDPLRKYLIDELKIDSEIQYFKYGDIEYSSKFSKDFLIMSFNEIFRKEFGFYGSDDIFLFFKLIDDEELIEVHTILRRIDKIYNLKRTKNQKLSIYTILDGVRGVVYHDIKAIVEYYLQNNYGIVVENGFCIFPFNKRDYTTIINLELKKLDSPIHYSDFCKILKLKYPRFRWREQTILSILIEDENFLNVGKGLYIHVSKRPYLKGLKTTEDVIIKYLSNKKNHRATISEIVAFVKQFRDVDDKSIESVLRTNKSGKFIKLRVGEYGIKGYMDKKWKDKR